MARIPNYYARGAAPTPLGSVFSQISQSILNGPDQGTRLLNAEKALTARRENVATNDLGDLVANVDTPDYGSIARQTVMSGYDPQDLGDLFRTVVANKFGVDNPRTSDAFVGAGGSFAAAPRGVRENFANQRTMEGMRQSGANSRNAATIGATNARHQNALAASMEELQYKLANELTGVLGADGPIYVPAADAVGQSPILSETDRLGTLLGQNFDDLGGLNEFQREVLDANPSSSSAGIGQKFDDAYNLGVSQGMSEEEARAYAFQQASKSGGISIAQGPDGGLEVSVGGPTGAGLTKSTLSQFEQADVDTQDALALMADLDAILASDPNVVGAAGNVQRLAQGVSSQVRGLQSVLGTPQMQAALGGRDLNAAFAEAAAGTKNSGLVPELFNTNLTDAQKLATVLAYKVAAAQGQRGQGASDRDIKLALSVIGDPAGWLTSAESMRSGMRRLEDAFLRRANIMRDQRGMNSLNPVLGPMAPAAGIDAETQRLLEKYGTQ